MEEFIFTTVALVRFDDQKISAKYKNCFSSEFEECENHLKI